MLHIKTINIFDFDGTLCASPENTQENRLIWESVTNKKWPHKGQKWWYEIETLDYKVFDIKLHQSIADIATASMNDPSIYTVLLTGRVPKFSSYVKEICRLNGLGYFDAYYFNDVSNTPTFKLAKMEFLKNEFPHVKNMVMWEDRVEHIPIFQKWGEENYGEGFVMNVVKFV